MNDYLDMHKSDQSTNLFSLNICREVHNICKPLFKNTKVIAFLYTELFPDGSRSEIGTSYDHLKLTYIDTKFMHRIYTGNYLYNSSTILVPEWVASTKDPNLKSQLENQEKYLDLGNELCLIKKRDTHFEYYHFYSRAGKKDIYNFYINKLESLQHFCIYFRQKAIELIKEARKNKILKPWRKIETMKIPTPYFQCDPFQDEMNITKFYLNDNLNTYLTKRELQCALQLIRNKSSSEIGKSLHLSKRTIENYLASVKSKLNCQKRTDLIKKLYELDLYYLVS